MDTVHDAQFDYYGKHVATCSSDRLVKIFSVTGNQVNHMADLVGHQGPVWEFLVSPETRVSVGQLWV
eukprot:jgi/Picre1/27960/NNA_000921.t1